jgi:hypothetical protein
MKDGKILGIGIDHLLYIRETLQSGWVWVPTVGMEMVLIHVAVMPDGSILGVDDGGKSSQGLYRRATLASPWLTVWKSTGKKVCGNVQPFICGLTVMPDGTIVAIMGLERRLVPRGMLTSIWQVFQQAAKPGYQTNLNSVAAMGDGGLCVTSPHPQKRGRYSLKTRAKPTSGWVTVYDNS